MVGVADVVGWGVIVAHVACAGLLVRYGKPLKCSHRILYTYLVVLIASFVSMMRLDENHELQIEIFCDGGRCFAGCVPPVCWVCRWAD